MYVIGCPFGPRQVFETAFILVGVSVEGPRQPRRRPCGSFYALFRQHDSNGINYDIAHRYTPKGRENGQPVLEFWLHINT
jgi:hypothetical protein